MSDQTVKLIIEAHDKTKGAFAELDKSIKGMDDATRTASGSGSALLGKLKQNWVELSAAAYAAWQAIHKAMEYIELGAKAMQAENAFAKTAESMNASAEKMLAAMKTASAGTIDDSHLMQKAIKAMAQDIDPNKIPALFEAARVGAVKSGEDISATADMIVDAVANNMPRALRKMGLVSKEEMNVFNKAVSAGHENLNLLDLVLYNTAIQAAKMGVETYNAAIAVQKFKAEIEEVKETTGKGLIIVLEKLWNVLKGAASGFVTLAAAMKSARATMLENEADKAEFWYKSLGAGASPDMRQQRLYDWQNKQFLANEARNSADELLGLSRSWRGDAQKSLFGKNYAVPGDQQDNTQAALDDKAAKAEKAKAALLAQWKRDAQSKELSDARKAELDAQLEGLRQGLELKKEGYKLEEAVADEKYQLDLQNEAAFVAEKQRLGEAALNATIAELNKEKEATSAAYGAMIGLAAGKSTAQADQAKLASEKKKDIARIDGDIANAQIDLQILAKAADIEAIKWYKQYLEDQTKAKKDALKQEDDKNKSIQKGAKETTEETKKELDRRKDFREADINSQLADLDLEEEMAAAHRDTIARRISLEEEMAAAQKDYLASMDKIKDPTAWLAQSTALDNTRRKLAELRKEFQGHTLGGALTISLKETGNNLMDLFGNVNTAVKKAFDGMAEALTDFVMTAKANFSDLANSIIRDMVRIAIQQQVTGPLAKAAGNYNWAGLFSKGSGAVDEAGGDFVVAGGQHAGGVIGGDRPTFYRIVPSALFSSAPRYHSGIGPGEKAAIIRDDEMVLTPGQQKRFLQLAQSVGGATGGISTGEINRAPTTIINNYSTTVPLTINALDSRSVAQTIQQHQDQIIGIINLAYNKRGQRGPLGS